MEQGVAAFENTIYEYVQAGGPEPSDSEMKDDLLRMLPERMQLDLLWQKADANVGFSEFRDTVVTQSARVMNTKSLNVEFIRSTSRSRLQSTLGPPRAWKPPS